LRAIDLCGGAGGWAVAARGLPIDIIATVDWWEPALQTYRLNHPQTLVIRGDCKQIPFKPEGFDLVLGGIPCQWLTVMRSKKLGNPVRDEEIVAERALLDALLSWIDSVDPIWWCLEDVPQLASELPMFTPYQIINAASFSGQRRKRIYVGRFPPPKTNSQAGLLATAYLRPGPYRVSPTALHRTPRRHQCFTAKTFFPIEHGRKMPTVIGMASRHDNQRAVIGEGLVSHRQMEWQEAAIAQGFPEDYVFVGSRTSVSKLVANAIQIDTGRAILEGIVERHLE
jgi:site-specific DNA-cytosine methylase